MAYEIINQGSVTPGRLKALLDIAYMSKSLPIDKNEINNIFQPGEPNTEATKYVIEAAVKMELIDKDTLVINKKLNWDGSYPRFIDIISDKLLFDISKSDDNGIFALYSAWSIMDASKYSTYADDMKFKIFKDKTKQKNQDKELFNSTKYAAWKVWASFVGIGYVFENKYLPIPLNRILRKLNNIYGKEKQLSVGEFLKRLGKVCPELDGGVNYDIYDDQRYYLNKKVSFAVSTVLEILNDNKIINIINDIGDAEMWTLWPHNFSENKFSHVAFLKQVGI